MQSLFPRAVSAYLSPASAFPDPEVESTFRADYIRGGHPFAVAAMLAGLLTVAAFMALAAWTPVDGSDGAAVQSLRALIAAACGVGLGVLVFKREWALRNQFGSVFLPALVVLMGLGMLLFVPRPALPSPLTAGHSTLSLCIALWMISAFCRLTLAQMMTIAIAASALNILGLQVLALEQFPFLVLDLIVINLLIWTVTVQTEKRERLLWFQATRTQRALREARRDARLTTVVNRAQSRMLRTVGHDIRQPLVSSAIYLDMLSRATRDEPSLMLDGNLQRLQACLRAVDSTVDRLLEPAHANGLDIDLPISRITLGDLFDDLADVFNPQALALGVTLHFTRLTDAPVMARSHRGALLEVLSNLVGNAIKFSHLEKVRRPVVLIGVARIGRQLRIDVTDNGIGIATSLQARVFEEHYRAPTARCTRGAGLGLTIVASTIKRLPDHRLQLTSIEGRGTRIRIYLPGA